MKTILFFAVCVLLFFPHHSIAQLKASDAEHVVTKIILIRHAEKSNDDPKDPSLSEEGEQRAERLARLFSEVSFDAFYATPYKRTIGTISPLANMQGKKIQMYNAADRNQILEIFDSGKGSAIIVAGHSNTIPPMVNLLIGKDKFPELDESEYSKIWVLVFKGDLLIDCSVLNY